MKKLSVIKIGGEVVNDAAKLEAFLAEFTELAGPKILVHGGGRMATELAARLGIATQMIDGRRVTDEATLQVAVMSYAGWINKTVVAALQRLGCNAIGLSGADGGTIPATRRAAGEVDYGFVGDPDPQHADTHTIGALLAAGLTPVFCAVTHDGQGTLLNTNADTVAATLAVAMSAHYATELRFCFDRPGVLADQDDDASVVGCIDSGLFARMKSSGQVSAGMVAKLENALAAARAGVGRVVICGHTGFATGGTVVSCGCAQPANDAPEPATNTLTPAINGSDAVQPACTPTPHSEKAQSEIDTPTLLRQLIAIPSLSGQERERAEFLSDFLNHNGLEVARIGNNLVSRISCGRADAPTVMLNSHLDTVAPAAGYTFDPFAAPHDHARVWGLGSNDAGGAVVSMIAATLHFARCGGLPFDLLLALSAEEENSGSDGLPLVLQHAGRIDCAIVGEPTMMRAAVAERGLIVLDGVAHGVAGHAARGEGKNAIYMAIDDIVVLRNYRFGRTSPLMGDVKVTVTQIEAGSQHNVVPDACRFVVDVRPTDAYANDEIVAQLQASVASTLTPRSTGHRSSATPAGHPLLRCAHELGIATYISPTTSDWTRLGTVPAIKMGPGDSARSHTADEYITVEELRAGIDGYINFLKHLKLN